MSSANNFSQHNPESFLKIIDPYLGSISAMIRFRIPWRDDWDDVLQNTLLCTWRELTSLKKNDSLKPWLMRVCSNCCNMHLRSNIRRRKFTENLKKEPNTSWSHTAMGRGIPGSSTDASIEVQRLLEELPDNERKALVDHYFTGLRVTEIADRINRPQGTVKRWMHSGRQRMKERLKENPKRLKEENHDK
ncbi:RNA polymerase sigma factor [bacterium]|nr:RNA polymerase sigma factor [bacterium]